MSMVLVSSLVTLLLAAPGPAPSTADLAAEARELYQRAATRLGTALGERADAQDPAAAALRAELAEILCLLSDVEGCLENSRQAGRSLGGYVSPLGGSPLPRRDLTRFLEELYRSSGTLCRDRSLISEALALLDQDAADAKRTALQAALAPEIRRLLQQARDAADAPVPLLAAFRLARLALDPERAAEIALRIEGALGGSRQDGKATAAPPEELSAALQEGADTLRILGREEEARRLVQMVQQLATKALTPPELSFELVPSPQDFTADLARAREQGLALARLAPLNSRASMVLHFAAAFAGVVAGDGEAAEELSNIAEAARMSDPYLGARIAVLLGYLAFQQGDFEGAGLLLAQAAGAPSLPKELSARALATRAQALHFLGDYATSAEEFARAAERFAPASPARLRALAGRCHALSFAGRSTEALENLEKASTLLPTLREPERGELGRTLELERALALLLSGKTAEAERAFTAVASASIPNGDVRSGVIARVNLAELLNDSGRFAQALEEAKAALQFLDIDRQPDAGWQALTEKGRALAGLGEAAEAESALKTAMDLVERLRARIGAEGARRSFSAAKTRLYQAAVAVQAASGRMEAAFETSERARARAFLDEIGERRLRLARHADQQRLDDARRRRLRGLPPPFSAPEEGAFALAPVPTSVDALPAPDPRQGWLSLARVNPATLPDVRAALRPNETLLSWFHDGRKLHLFAVSRKDFRAASMEIPTQEIEGRIAGFLRTLQQPQRGEGLLRDKGHEIYRLLLEPLGDFLAKTPKLTLVPWGPLHRLPLGALWDGQRYLTERFEFSSAPSASALVLVRSRPAQAKGAVLALGNPRTDLPDLPAAQGEAREVARHFPGAALLVGERATKAALLERAPSARLLHVSAHGIFLPQRPLESYLVLAGATPEAGRLSGLEVLGLDLALSPLVVLSACASGQAEAQPGEELMGLSRAFLQAGASALLASLWNVADDGTRELFGAFYRSLRSGQAPASALSAAARTLIHGKKYSHPFYWAAFQTIGG